MRTRTAFAVSVLVLTIGWAPPTALAFLLMDPPPDVDKSGTHTPDYSCWQATAANMLAAVGYGTGSTVQQRAGAIYSQMTAYFGFPNNDDPNKAGQWWLQSAHNVWPTNPYKEFTFYVSSAKYNDAPQTIANTLRKDEPVAVRIKGNEEGGWAHWLSAFGDEGGASPLSANPAQIWVTDSDKNTTNVQKYTYDAHQTGKLWKFDYYSTHPEMTSYLTLSPTQKPSTSPAVQKVTNIYTVPGPTQQPATDLHYLVATDVEILSYHTSIDWPNAGSPAITELSSRKIQVEWNFSSNPIPVGTPVKIKTEFVLPVWNSVWCGDVHFTYDNQSGGNFPGFDWQIDTPDSGIPANAPGTTGGYVIGAFDLFYDSLREFSAGTNLFQHEYGYWQDPERHEFQMEALEDTTYYVGNVRFGHSWGYLDDDSLQNFQDWLTVIDTLQPFAPGSPLQVTLDWDGRVPYPEGLPDFSIVPEPGTLWLLAMGSLILLGYAWRLSRSGMKTP